MDRAEREQQYSPSSMLDGSLDPLIGRYVERSAAAYRDLDHQVTVAYGPDPANTIDIALPHQPGPFNDAQNATEPVPIHVFIHGGYWQELSKRESFFLAPSCVTQGSAFAAVDYTLAPLAPIDSIVNECRAALQALHHHGPELGFDPTTMVVSGSSAGAHLAAMATLRLEPRHRPAGLILVSGVYELEPLVDTYINDLVAMDVNQARAVSPLLAPLDDFPPSVVAYGDNETEEFKRQSHALVDRLRQADRPAVEVELTGRNHFDAVFDIVSLLAPRLP
jgi:arylformamidase